MGTWPSLEGIIRDGGAGTELDGLLAALGGEGVVDAQRLREWLDAVDDACARRGLTGVTTREYSYQALPTGASGPVVGAWVCPRGCCDRVVLPEEAATPPTCAVAGRRPMKPFRVAP